MRPLTKVEEFMALSQGRLWVRYGLLTQVIYGPLVTMCSTFSLLAFVLLPADAVLSRGPSQVPMNEVGCYLAVALLFAWLLRKFALIVFRMVPVEVDQWSRSCVQCCGVWSPVPSFFLGLGFVSSDQPGDDDACGCCELFIIYFVVLPMAVLLLIAAFGAIVASLFVFSKIAFCLARTADEILPTIAQGILRCRERCVGNTVTQASVENESTIVPVVPRFAWTHYFQKQLLLSLAIPLLVPFACRILIGDEEPATHTVSDRDFDEYLDSLNLKAASVYSVANSAWVSLCNYLY